MKDFTGNTRRVIYQGREVVRLRVGGELGIDRFDWCIYICNPWLGTSISPLKDSIKLHSPLKTSLKCRVYHQRIWVTPDEFYEKLIFPSLPLKILLKIKASLLKITKYNCRLCQWCSMWTVSSASENQLVKLHFLHLFLTVYYPFHSKISPGH